MSNCNYLISLDTGLPVATVAAYYKESVAYGWETTGGGKFLVNGRRGKISRAKKWMGWEERHRISLPFAREISSTRQFLIEGE